MYFLKLAKKGLFWYVCSNPLYSEWIIHLYSCFRPTWYPPPPPLKPSLKPLSLKVFMPNPHFQIYYYEKHQYTNSHVSVIPPPYPLPRPSPALLEKGFLYVESSILYKTWTLRHSKHLAPCFSGSFSMFSPFACQIRHLRSTARPHHLQPLPLGVQPPGQAWPDQLFQSIYNPTNSDGSVRRVELRHKRAWYQSGELRLKSENAIRASTTK